MATTAVMGCILLAGNAVLAESDTELIAQARAIHKRVLTIDTHVDIPFNFGSDAYDMMKPGPLGQQVHLPTMTEGGLDAVFLIVYVGQSTRTITGNTKALSDAFLKFSAIHKLTEESYPNEVELARTAEDVRRISASGRKAVIIGMENGFPMGKDLRLLDVFYDQGARYLGLLHNGHNELGDSAQPFEKEDTAEHGGLSSLGKEVVTRLNKLGIMIDVSHASKQTTLDILALSKAPVIASHSAIRGIGNHPRNLSDIELDAIKNTNGVVNLVAFDTYLRSPSAEKTEALDGLRKKMELDKPGAFQKLNPEQLSSYYESAAAIDAKWPKAGVADLVDHIDYAVRRIGIDHVGIASDFNGGGGITGWNNAGETLNVTLELVKRGYSEDEIAKIWGGNLLRVMEDVEAYAAQMKN
ncbi:MAG TPA: peptidase M19 [Rhodospirillaceae bacterium]|nr:peptidase M19 [Candidatus Neomarinimicrobiota bacterium]HCX14594.1 peptidase M19 [Rhodospirillaceae bacterium]